MAKGPRLDIDEGDLRKKLKRAVEKKENIATARTFDTGDDVGNKVKAGAPRRSGELASSIEIEKKQGRNGPEVFVKVKADHAVPQEFGTSTMPPNPFFRPALAEAPALLKRRSRRR